MAKWGEIKCPRCEMLKRARMTDADIAQARRYYMHVQEGGTLTARDVGRMVEAMEVMQAKLEAIEALMVRRIQSVSYNQDTLSDSRKRKNSVREYALSLALGEIRQVIKGQTGGTDDRVQS